MERTVLHRVVREHFEDLRAEVAARTDSGGLPPFVEREFDRIQALARRHPFHRP